MLNQNLSQSFFQVAGQLDWAILMLLLITSVVSLAVIFERFFFFRNARASQIEIDRILQSFYRDPKLERLEDLKNMATMESELVNFLWPLLAAQNEKGFDERYNTFVTQKKFDLERYLNFLATIGSNAPYIGLLGTVLGIMKAFHDLALQSDAGVQTVMAGISSALLATAAGLFVAIPAVIAYNAFQKKVRAILQRFSLIRDAMLMVLKSNL